MPRGFRGLKDGGYICERRLCIVRQAHTHCECGMPRARGQQLCNICKLEIMGIRPGQNLRSDEFLMSFARLMAPGNDRRGFGYAKAAKAVRAR